MNERPYFDMYFMQIAEVVSTRSTWLGTKVGCVVTNNNHIVSTGYNGTPRGWSNFIEKSKKNSRYCCHAEENAIVQAAQFGINLTYSVFYTTLSPCLTCARMIVNVNAQALIFKDLWDDREAEESLELLKKSKITVRRTIK